MLRVLTEPRNALVKQYEALFEMSGVELRFTTPALREMAKAAIGKNTGARGLRRIMVRQSAPLITELQTLILRRTLQENLLLDSMYAAPGSSIRYILIDRAVARGEKPAVFFSRGQKHIFQNEFDADEHATGSATAEEIDGQASAPEDEVKNDEEGFDEERRQPQRRAATG